jgi:alpha-mannosidase
LQLYPDWPDHFDAWDLGFNKYTQAPSVVTDLQSAKLVENGPVRQVIELRRNGEKETYVQRVILYAGADSVDFETLVNNWGDPAHRFLKVAFPTAIANPAKQVRHNIPYGSQLRVLDGHRADTEFHGHKWTDVVETRTDGRAPTMGLALINREKYGYDIANDGRGEGLSDGKCNILRLSLLKSGTSPACRVLDAFGPVTDIGDFMTHYRVYPHGGATAIDDLYRRGESFANPLLLHAATPHTGSLPSVGKLLSVAAPGGNVVATTLKRPARDPANRELVLRLVELDGVDTTANFDCSAFDVASAIPADILERREIGAGGDSFSTALPLGAHAVQTYRVVFGEQPPLDDDASAEPEDDDTQPPPAEKKSEGHGACCG